MKGSTIAIAAKLLTFVILIAGVSCQDQTLLDIPTELTLDATQPQVFDNLPTIEFTTT